MRITIISVLLLFLVSVCFSASSDVGTTTAQFLKLGAGARASGMGEAFTAIADDANAIYWNPAGLNQIEKISFSFMHSLLSTDNNYEWLSYVQPTKLGIFGIGMQYVSYGSLTETDSSGNEISSFSPNDMSIALSYAFRVVGISLGANLKYVSSTVKNTASGSAIDIGGKYDLEKISIGVLVQNVGSVQGEDRLPLNFRLGGAYAIKENWLCGVDINVPNDNEISFRLGTEYNYKINDNMTVVGRTGYNSSIKNITIGLGWNLSGYSIDYAYVPYESLGATHKISLSKKF